MTADQAEAVKQELLRICNRYGLWYTIETEHKPNIRIIRIKDISIKITE